MDHGVVHMEVGWVVDSNVGQDSWLLGGGCLGGW